MRKGLGNPVRREALFGGTGAVLVWDLMPRPVLRPFTAVLACELAPGGCVGTHVQEHDAEIVVVTEGEGTAELDGVAHPISTGAVLALPLGSTLSLANGSSEEPLRYLIIKAEPAEDGGGSSDGGAPR